MRKNFLRQSFALLVTFLITFNFGTPILADDSVKGQNNAAIKTGVKAFPGAEGFGAYAAGGRGGDVYHVTTLAASGPGSLTYGIEELYGPRTIVFDVGGIIDLSELGREIRINGESGSNITIAGQTAPFPGIELKGYGLIISNAHDVIVRHLRIRNGGIRNDGSKYQADPLSLGGSRRIILDHLSMQWAIDMGFRMTGEDLTLSNSIISQALSSQTLPSANSPHDKSDTDHDYAGMINNGVKRASFIKNLVKDSEQRSPRLTDGAYIDAYSNLLFNCESGFDLCNYEWMNKNVKVNVHNNLAVKGSLMSNEAPYRAFRGRNYSGGVMAYFEGNTTTCEGDGTEIVPAELTFGTFMNHFRMNNPVSFGENNEGTDSSGAAYSFDLSAVTFDDWDGDARSYDSNDKSENAALFTLLDYPLPAPRGNVITGAAIKEYVTGSNGAGATRPMRDIYDKRQIAEVIAGTNSTVTLPLEISESYYSELERRTGIDYSAYKAERQWTVQKGEGPKFSEIVNKQPNIVNWNLNTGDVYDENGAFIKNETHSPYTDKKIPLGGWWAEYVGFPDEKVTVVRTVADLYPAEFMINNDYKAAEAMDEYRIKHYEGKPDNTPIIWDSCGDGIADWYKEYRGFDTGRAVNNLDSDNNGYTNLEEFLAFMAGDAEFVTDTSSQGAENFKIGKLGYSSAQLFWNTRYRSTSVIEYGTEDGVYTNKEILNYSPSTMGYHTYHSVVLTSLAQDTTYYYRVITTDDIGNVSTSAQNTFKTMQAPREKELLLPSKPVITSVTPYIGQVMVKWDGDIMTDSGYEIWYDTASGGGIESNYKNRITDIQGGVTSEKITGLSDGTEYYFVVAATNQNGKTLSEEFTATPSKTVFSYDYTSMTGDEKAQYIKKTFLYTLGGEIRFDTDPDTGKTILIYEDTTPTHGVDSYLPFRVTQTESCTINARIKIVYAFNSDNDTPGVYDGDHAQFQLNVFRDGMVNENLDSTDSEDWSTAFSVVFDMNELKYSGKTVAAYDAGKTTTDTPVKTWKDGPSPHGFWEYEKGTAQYYDLKIEADCVNNNVKVYLNGEEVLEDGTFGETIDAPYNVGRIQFKTRTSGYITAIVESVSVVNGISETGGGIVPVSYKYD